MLRRLALLVSLLSPVAGLAQVSGQVLVVPSVYGRSDCTATASMYVTWASSVAPIFGTVADDFFRIKVSNTSGCPDTTVTITTGVLKDNLGATGLTQRYPTVVDSAVTPAAFFALAGVDICGTKAATVYVCITQWPFGGGGSSATPKWTGNSDPVTLEVADPPVPASVSVSPGDSSLFVSWADGPSTGVNATKYNVTAVGATGTSTQTFTGKTNNRFTGLTNGVSYSITVTAVSAGGNESGASAPVLGTPAQVNGFWEQYKADGGSEPGGCGGGPAGVVSLLGVALALRGLRRRS